MKKIVISILVVVVAALAVTGAASAQTPNAGTGSLHDYMVAALADALHLTVADVDARLDAGVTMYQVALDEGTAAENIPALMTEVRTNAVTAAVADGVITQAQADWMLQRMAGRGYGNGSGMMRGAGGAAGIGSGQGSCNGTGIPVGMGPFRGGGRGQKNP